ncbi:hypothetical protein CEXT_94331 [Caerostris extrusa]|uniref:Uncharacterized protein n=1 Tax=Caerostris extrusa TaxID=172846 RepID=A0AAV4RDL6_CAEEX|nr:hypothetical protein CEXT_94331 [Caerostris extrusa]
MSDSDTPMVSPNNTSGANSPELRNQFSWILSSTNGQTPAMPRVGYDYQIRPPPPYAPNVSQSPSNSTVDDRTYTDLVPVRTSPQFSQTQPANNNSHLAMQLASSPDIVYSTVPDRHSPDEGIVISNKSTPMPSPMPMNGVDSRSSCSSTSDCNTYPLFFNTWLIVRQMNRLGLTFREY